MAGRRSQIKIPIQRIISYQDLGVELKEVHDVEFESPAFSFFDIKSGEQLTLTSVLLAANDKFATPEGLLVVYDDTLENFCLITKADLEKFKHKISTSTDYVKDGVIFKGCYVIPSKEWW